MLYVLESIDFCTLLPFRGFRAGATDKDKLCQSFDCSLAAAAPGREIDERLGMELGSGWLLSAFDTREI